MPVDFSESRFTHRRASVLQAGSLQSQTGRRKAEGRGRLTASRVILEVLRAELRFLEQGGYSQPAGTIRKPKLIFFDSPTCVNFRDPQRRDPCSECALMTLVPLQHRPKPFPCHFIPLNEAGDTVNSLNPRDEAWRYETLGNWLRTMIAQLERATKSGLR
jgi:hypothetical protein